VKAQIDWNGSLLTVDFSQGRSLAIDLQPGGPHPSFFSDSAARVRPLARDGFVGDMTRGGSCNAQVIEFSPHSHGTHTECIGHISPDHASVTGTIDQQPTLMQLITVPGELLDNGRLIPAGVLAGIDRFDGKALAVRTMPNELSKQWRNYDESPVYPVFSPDAMSLLSNSPLLHLLIDTPSLDNSDNTELENHAIWWGMDGSTTRGVPNPGIRSITEMIFVADEIADGEYWLDLQLPPLISDAVPSRPMVFPVKRHDGSSR
jgi:kynurenine formamidase